MGQVIADVDPCQITYNTTWPHTRQLVMVGITNKNCQIMPTRITLNRYHKLTEQMSLD